MLVGFFDIMIRYVRTISDTVRAKLVLVIFCLLVLGTQPSYGQQEPSKQVTQQQTNEKIRELAGLARTPTPGHPDRVRRPSPYRRVRCAGTISRCAC